MNLRTKTLVATALTACSAIALLVRPLPDADDTSLPNLARSPERPAVRGAAGSSASRPDVPAPVEPLPARERDLPGEGLPGPGVGRDPAASSSEELLSQVRDASLEEGARHLALYDLVNRHGVTRDVAEALVRLLPRVRDPELAATVLWALGLSGEPFAVEAIAGFAGRTPFVDARLAAVDALGVLGTTESASSLIAILGSDPAEDVRGQAATVLGASFPGDPGASAALTVAAARDGSPEVRARAIDGLASARAALALESIASAGLEPGERTRAAELAAQVQAAEAADPRNLSLMYSTPARPVENLETIDD